MGPEQLAGTLSIVARQAAEAAGRPFDEAADAQRRRAIEDQIERESLAPFTSGRLFDDGIVDPRDSRTVLGIALSAVHANAIAGARGGFGVFRM
jgi:acetyl-CoA carboxylase carboxyltransferase component